MAYEPMSPMSTRRLTGRNTNRYSVTALFSMAAEQDVEVEDDLAKGGHCRILFIHSLNRPNSTETAPGPQVKNISTIQEEFCFGARCAILGFSDCFADSKQNGPGRGVSFVFTVLRCLTTSITATRS